MEERSRIYGHFQCRAPRPCRFAIRQEECNAFAFLLCELHLTWPGIAKCSERLLDSSSTLCGCLAFPLGTLATEEEELSINSVQFIDFPHSHRLIIVLCHSNCQFHERRRSERTSSSSSWSPVAMRCQGSGSATRAPSGYERYKDAKWKFAYKKLSDNKEDEEIAKVVVAKSFQITFLRPSQSLVLPQPSRLIRWPQSGPGLGNCLAETERRTRNASGYEK